METKVIKGHAPIEVEVKQAKDFVDALIDGKDPDEAAREVGVPLPALRGHAAVRKWLEDLAPWFIDDPDVRRKTVIATATRIMASDDVEDKEKLAAARLLARDPELGFQNTEPLVTINISEDVKKMDPGQLWPDEKEKEK